MRVFNAGDEVVCLAANGAPAIGRVIGAHVCESSDGPDCYYTVEYPTAWGPKRQSVWRGHARVPDDDDRELARWCLRDDNRRRLESGF